MNKIRVAQVSMERAILGVSKIDRVPHTEVRSSGVVDAIARWNWAGHLARITEDRWAKRITECRSRHNVFRSRKRPQAKPH